MIFHAGREVGGHWDSGLPYLQGALKTHWVPMGGPANPLQGVQLLLDHINVAPLKVLGPFTEIQSSAMAILLQVIADVVRTFVGRHCSTMFPYPEAMLFDVSSRTLWVEQNRSEILPAGSSTELWRAALVTGVASKAQRNLERPHAEHAAV